MRGCEHDRVFSGQTNLEQKFAFICKTCGELGWSDTYDLHRVDFDEYCRQRVLHGWASNRPSHVSARHATRLSPVPPRADRLRLPAPPRVPAISTAKPRQWPLMAAICCFVITSVLCSIAAIPWEGQGSVLPVWRALVASGICLLVATMLYVVWKGSTNG